jgi:hypothetical protein
MWRSLKSEIRNSKSEIRRPRFSNFEFRICVALLPLAALVCWTPAAPACPPAGEIRVTVVAILACDKNDAKVDPKLAEIAKEIQKKKPKLVCFRMGRSTCLPIEVNKEEKIDLVEGKTVLVTLLQGPEKDNRVRLRVKAPGVGEVTYKTCCGKYFPLVTGVKTKDGKSLIIAIKVQPCMEKK